MALLLLLLLFLFLFVYLAFCVFLVFVIELLNGVRSTFILVYFFYSFSFFTSFDIFALLTIKHEIENKLCNRLIYAVVYRNLFSFDFTAMVKIVCAIIYGTTSMKHWQVTSTTCDLCFAFQNQLQWKLQKITLKLDRYGWLNDETRPK